MLVVWMILSLSGPSLAGKPKEVTKAEYAKLKHDACDVSKGGQCGANNYICTKFPCTLSAGCTEAKVLDDAQKTELLTEITSKRSDAVAGTFFKAPEKGADETVPPAVKPKAYWSMVYSDELAFMATCFSSDCNNAPATEKACFNNVAENAIIQSFPGATIAAAITTPLGAEKAAASTAITGEDFNKNTANAAYPISTLILTDTYQYVGCALTSAKLICAFSPHKRDPANTAVTVWDTTTPVCVAPACTPQPPANFRPPFEIGVKEEAEKKPTVGPIIPPGGDGNIKKKTKKNKETKSTSDQS